MALVIGGNSNDCVLMLHGDGDDGSTTIRNDAAGGLAKSITAHSSARLTHAESKFAPGSLECDGGGGYVQVDPSSDFRWTDQDWTIDFWARANDPLRAYYFAFYLDGDNFLALERVNTAGMNTRFQLRYRLAGVDQYAVGSLLGTHIAVRNWTHFAITRAAGSVYLFIGGAAYGSHVHIPGQTIEPMNLESWPLYIGQSLWKDQPGLRTMDGWIDEFRILRGTAAWTGAFTPYSNPYSKRFRQRIRSHANVRESFRHNSRMAYGVALRPFRHRLRATAHARCSYRQRLRTVGAIYDSFRQTVRAVDNTVLRSFRQSVRGLHHVRTAFRQRVRGLAAVHSGTFRQRLRSSETVREPFRHRIRGVGNTLAAFRQKSRDLHRVENTTLALYELYYGNGSPPDLTAAPWRTFSSTPYDSPAISGVGKHYFVLRRRNAHNMVSRNIESTVFELDGSDDQITEAPADPTAVTIAAASAATARVQGVYRYDEDAAAKGDAFLIYLRSNGTDPDPASDSPTVVTMNQKDGVARLDWTSGGFGDLDDVRVIVRTRRTTPLRDSISTAVLTVIVTTQAPDPVVVDGRYQQVGGGPVQM